MEQKTEDFKKELKKLINQYSIDNDINIPDFVLTEYIINSLNNLKNTNNKTTILKPENPVKKYRKQKIQKLKNNKI